MFSARAALKAGQDSQPCITTEGSRFDRRRERRGPVPPSDKTKQRYEEQGTDAFRAHMDLKRSDVGRPGLGIALGVAFGVRVAEEAQLGQVVLHVRAYVNLANPWSLNC